jgi:hypothetical protein
LDPSGTSEFFIDNLSLTRLTPAVSTQPSGGFVMDKVSEIQSMWDACKTQRFPSEYSGKDVAGICVTSLDSFAAGCIDTFIFRKGHLDEQRISILAKCKNDLEVVVNALDGSAQIYFNNLLLLSRRVLQLVGY